MFEAARTQPAPIAEETNDMELQEQLNEANARIVVLQQDAARLREALLLRDARDQARDALAAAPVPDVTRARLLESLSANPPTDADGGLDAAALAATISEAITAEQTYLAQATGTGRIVGMGATAATAAQPADLTEKFAAAFQALGLTPAEAVVAARGR
jgi:hypothetical protein